MLFNCPCCSITPICQVRVRVRLGVRSRQRARERVRVRVRVPVPVLSRHEAQAGGRDGPRKSSTDYLLRAWRPHSNSRWALPVKLRTVTRSSRIISDQRHLPSFPPSTPQISQDVVQERVRIPSATPASQQASPLPSRKEKDRRLMERATDREEKKGLQRACLRGAKQTQDKD